MPLGSQSSMEVDKTLKGDFTAEDDQGTQEAIGTAAQGEFKRLIERLKEQEQEQEEEKKKNESNDHT